MAEAHPARIDFFISYTSADRAWAEWIAWCLEQAGYSILIQAWDFPPGSNVVYEMDMALTRAMRVVAVLSPAYVLSAYAFSEWAVAFEHDPWRPDKFNLSLASRLRAAFLTPQKSRNKWRPWH